MMLLIAKIRLYTMEKAYQTCLSEPFGAPWGGGGEGGGGGVWQG